MRSVLQSVAVISIIVGLILGALYLVVFIPYVDTDVQIKEIKGDSTVYDVRLYVRRGLATVVHYEYFESLTSPQVDSIKNYYNQHLQEYIKYAK